jgi:hypothetical protein
VLWVCPHCGTCYDADRACPVCVTADELRCAIAELASAYFELGIAEEGNPSAEIVQMKEVMAEAEGRLEAVLRAVTGEGSGSVVASAGPPSSASRPLRLFTPMRASEW